MLSIKQKIGAAAAVAVMTIAVLAGTASAQIPETGSAELVTASNGSIADAWPIYVAMFAFGTFLLVVRKVRRG